jgi:hypothetical protein
MGKRDITPTGHRHCVVAVRIAFALAALTPGVAVGADHAPTQLMPSSTASPTAIVAGEVPREAAEWERLRRHAHHVS